MLVGNFGARPGGKTWAILRHPYALGSRLDRSMQLLGVEERHRAGNGCLCPRPEKGQPVSCSAKQGRNVVREPRPGLGGLLGLVVGVGFSVIAPRAPQRNKDCTQPVCKVP